MIEGGMKTIPKQLPGLFDYEHRMQKLEDGPDPLARLNARSDWKISGRIWNEPLRRRPRVPAAVPAMMW